MVCLLGPKWSDDVMSLSQLNAVSTFSYGETFHKTCFSPIPRGLFCNILVILIVVPSQRGLSCPFPLSSGLPRALFNSTVYIYSLLCFGECGGGSWSSRCLFRFPCEFLVRLGEVAGNRFLMNLWLIFCPGETRPTRAFFF